MKLRLLAIAILLALSACASQKTAAVPDHPNLIVTTDWLANHVADSKVAVLAVETDRETFDKGHIPGARLVLLRDLLEKHDNVPNELPPVDKLVNVFRSAGISDDTFVVLYGAEGGLAAARAYFTLDYLGHGDRAALLDGGFEKWTAEHRAVSTEATTIAAGNFTAKPRPEIVATAEQTRDLSTKQGVLIVDARPAEQYSGETPGDGISRPGHIPGAQSLFWKENLTSDGVLRPIGDLQTLWQTAGTTPSTKTVVTYCRTGMQASYEYFVAKLLGYDVKMYDGSFIDWSNREGFAVEK